MNQWLFPADELTCCGNGNRGDGQVLFKIDLGRPGPCNIKDESFFFLHVGRCPGCVGEEKSRRKVG